MLVSHTSRRHCSHGLDEHFRLCYATRLVGPLVDDSGDTYHYTIGRRFQHGHSNAGPTEEGGCQEEAVGCPIATAARDTLA